MRKINIMTVLALLILFLMVPAGCKNASPLEGTRWSLIEINGGGIIDGTYISLSFYGNTAEGNGGCNRYYGEYSTEEPNLLNIQGPGGTDEGC